MRLQNFASYLSQHTWKKRSAIKKADTIISKVVIFGLKKQVRNFFFFKTQTSKNVQSRSVMSEKLGGPFGATFPPCNKRWAQLYDRFDPGKNELRLQYWDCIDIAAWRVRLFQYRGDAKVEFTSAVSLRMSTRKINTSFVFVFSRWESLLGIRDQNSF